jgi:hypothetical protein
MVIPVRVSVLVKAFPVYVVCELLEYSVLLTPKEPAPLQPVPSTSTLACTLPPLSVSVIRLFVGTLAEAAIDPKFIEVGDKLIEQNPCTFAVSETVAGPEPKEAPEFMLLKVRVWV